MGKTGWVRSAGKAALLLEAGQLFERIESFEEGPGEWLVELMVETEGGIGLPDPVSGREAKRLLQVPGFDTDHSVHDLNSSASQAPMPAPLRECPETSEITIVYHA